MPRRKEADPIVLAERKAKKREKHKIRMRGYRSKVRNKVAELLNNALTHVDGSVLPRGEVQGLAARTARSILRGSLSRHGITVERICAVLAEGLQSVKLRESEGKVVSLPDCNNRLRAGDAGLRLLERVGDLPLPEEYPAGSITLNVLVIGEKDESTPVGEMRTITAEENQ